MKVIEGAVDFVKAIITEGIPGLWKWVAEKLTDLKDQVIGQIKDFVVTKIVMAGITWLISLLNPAAAFVKACKMNYDAVMWFVDNAERLKDFVNSILDSVESIASGGVGAVAGYIENTMSKIVPMLISGLASLLGLGGIADKIKKILETVQKPVGKVVDKLVGTAVKYGKKLIGKVKGSKLGKAAKAKFDKVKAKVLGGDDTPEGKQKRLDKGLTAGVGVANRYAGKTVGEGILRPLFSVIRFRYGLQTVEPVREGNRWAVHAEVQRERKSTDALAASGDLLDVEPQIKVGDKVNLYLSVPLEGKCRSVDAKTKTIMFDVLDGDKIVPGIGRGFGWHEFNTQFKADGPVVGPHNSSRLQKDSRIKIGTTGPFMPGLPFPPEVIAAAMRENPLKACVFCGRIGKATQVDHAIPRARGGNHTLDNAQLACQPCNGSKGDGDRPKSKPPGYQGPWPPSWW